jgi:hypothetical protein
MAGGISPAVVDRWELSTAQDFNIVISPKWFATLAKPLSRPSWGLEWKTGERRNEKHGAALLINLCDSGGNDTPRVMRTEFGIKGGA